MEFGESFHIFASITAAIFLEAMPFLAFGALVSAIMEVYVPVERLSRLMPDSLSGGVALGLSAGLLLPTCECGVVPIVRRLIAKGVPPHVAVTYMLAAPIINPLVLASTYVAFRGSLTMVMGRILTAAIVAASLGLLVRRFHSSNILSSGADDQNGHTNHDHCRHHIDSHEDYPEGSGLRTTRLENPARVLNHAAHDFLEMGRYLVLGAIAAAFFKTFLPQAVFTYFGANLVLSICGMMILAVLLSICSEADAFVAASFVSFPQASQLAFVTIGPMVDLKLIGMYAATFHRRLFLTLLIVPTLLVFVMSLAYGVFTWVGT